jgi:phosphoribosylglycinamide formyltransferase-1
VLASGAGSNLQAILDRLHGRAVDVVAVGSDKPGAPALGRALALGVQAREFPVAAHADRGARDRALAVWLSERDVELVVLAGYMQLLSPAFLAAFPLRVINVHPALLPAFPGLHAERQALEYGARVTGVTVHFVDEETDHGPILAQAVVPVLADDTEATLHARVQRQEHRLYPFAIQLIAEGRVHLEGRRVRVDGSNARADDALANPDPSTA